MTDTILRLPAVKARTGLSRTTIYMRIYAGTFPRPVSLGPRAVGWVEKDIEEWIKRHIASGWNTAASTKKASK